MPTNKPTLVTICTYCKRENVGVVLDWNHRNGGNQVIKRYRVATHKVEYNAKANGVRRKDVPTCQGSRLVVPEEVVMPYEKV